MNTRTVVVFPGLAGVQFAYQNRHRLVNMVASDNCHMVVNGDSRDRESCFLMQIAENHRAGHPQMLSAHPDVFQELNELGITPWAIYPSEENWSERMRQLTDLGRDAVTVMQQQRKLLDVCPTLPNVRHLILGPGETVFDIIRFNANGEFELID